MKKNACNTLFCIFVVLFSVFACERMERDGMKGAGDSLRNRLPDNICLFDPSEYFGGERITKSSSAPVIVETDALDLTRSETVRSGDKTTTQIELDNEGVLASTILKFNRIECEESPLSSPGTAKTFLVFQSESPHGDTIANIVTIIPQPKHMTQGGIDSLSFFHLTGLNGVVVFSDLYGKVLDIELFINGEIISHALFAKSADYEADSVIATIGVMEETLLTQTSLTRNDEEGGYFGGMLDEAVCVASPLLRDDGTDPLPGAGDVTFPKEIVDHVQNPCVGGGGGENGDNMGEVVISVVGKGCAVGGGYHAVGKNVKCKAFSQKADTVYISKFVCWDGASSSTDSLTSVAVDEKTTYRLTAFFHDKKPCGDSLKNDPLLQMKIQGTPGSGVNGGRFGYTRNGGTSEHSGIDLAAPEGTPVYSISSGRVIIVKTNMPYMMTFEEYDASGAPKMTKPSYNTGNAIYIEGEIDGEIYVVNYFHLMAVEVSVGDHVEIGDVIGLTGITGNAFGKGCGGPHLHLGIKKNGVFIDPEPFLHSILDQEGKQTNPCNN